MSAPPWPWHVRPGGVEEAVWGWGAAKVDSPAGWLCPQCGKKLGKLSGRHTYADGAERCTPCAELWARANGLVRPSGPSIAVPSRPQEHHPRPSSPPPAADPSGQYRLAL